MCGITGFFSENVRSFEQIAFEMAYAIHHRGPDDYGTWVAPNAPLALAHRRLSILDLSPLGRQPMASASGRFTITFNGEIYNYRDLKAVLLTEGYPFRGTSDTEVMLAAFERWGVEESLQRSVGMFAFAVWDNHERRLYLARDRMGEKPLYFGWTHGAFLFGSELKALQAFPEISLRVNRAALVLFLKYNCVPAPHSIYEGIYKLLPGTFLSLSMEDLASGGVGFSPWPDKTAKRAPKRYWDAAACAGSEEEWNPKRDDEVLAELESLLSRAVKSQMVSDVPVGAFLSGGIDSSLVVALMQSAHGSPVKTFSIGFREAGYNEAHHAAKVAAHLGTDHTELYVTPRETLNVVPLLPSLYDEPFADSSQIPTFLVSSLARTKVTVSLSGDGGDELFGGYERFLWAEQAWKRLDQIPPGLRTTLGATLGAPGLRTWDMGFRAFRPIFRKILGINDPAAKVMRLSGVMRHEERESLYQELLVHWPNADSVVIGGKKAATYFDRRAEWKKAADFLDQMMFLDSVTYLPDDILVKVDRAAMGVSLETRAPLLDHRVVEFAARLPSHVRIRNGVTKWPLRQLLYRYVPKELIERPKMGFGVPLDSWLRGALKEWASDLLSPDRIRREGFFDPEPIQRKWKEHVSGRRNWHYPLWDILMFQSWLEAHRGKVTRTGGAAIGAELARAVA